MMNSSPYSLGTDGSNDEGSLKKLNSKLIRLFDSHKGKVCSQLLGIVFAKRVQQTLFSETPTPGYYKIKFHGMTV